MLKFRSNLQNGQALVEYLLVMAMVALVCAGLLGAWKLPMARYLARIAETIAQAR